MFMSIPLFEHKKLSFSEIPQEDISARFNDNEFVSNIERFLEKNALEEVLSFDRTYIKPSHYVGVIKYKNIQFEILPKLLGQDDYREDNRKQILKNTQRKSGYWYGTPFSSLR